MDNKPAESRNFPRVKFSGTLACQIRGSHEIMNTIGEDLSFSGIRFINDAFIPRNTPVMLEINLLSKIIKPIAQIIWFASFPRQDKFHFGAQFLELNQKDKQSLSDFLALTADQ